VRESNAWNAIYELLSVFDFLFIESYALLSIFECNINRTAKPLGIIERRPYTEEIPAVGYNVPKVLGSLL